MDPRIIIDDEEGTNQVIRPLGPRPDPTDPVQDLMRRGFRPGIVQLYTMGKSSVMTANLPPGAMAIGLEDATGWVKIEPGWVTIAQTSEDGAALRSEESHPVGIPPPFGRVRGVQWLVAPGPAGN